MIEIMYLQMYFLKVQKTSKKQNKSVEILLSVPGDDLIVKKDAQIF